MDNSLDLAFELIFVSFEGRITPITISALTTKRSINFFCHIRKLIDIFLSIRTDSIILVDFIGFLTFCLGWARINKFVCRIASVHICPVGL